ncbi:MAG: RNA polymerase sigma factor [Pseudomonadota bacterium]
MLVATLAAEHDLTDDTGKQTSARLRRNLDQFLAGVEQRALAIAQISLHDYAESMDVVQDAMIRLVKSYANRPADEWTPLFYRILNNRIRDTQRRRKVRNRVMSWFGSGRDNEEPDPIASAPDRQTATPLEALEAEETHAKLSAAVAALPSRQREAFMLRSMEGLDTRSSAVAMACSEGSVKTHYSRALNSLREVLAE